MKNNSLPFSTADILLPDFSLVSPYKWAVVACDQFTSEPEYWEQAEEAVKDSPSTLRLILPEVYLKETEQRLPVIQQAMVEYEQKHLHVHKDSMIYVERTQSDGSIRRGVVLAVDLEQYDYRKGASSLIRATEATVIERIPPRVAIRRGATVELPHVMLLIDDPHRTVIEPLTDSTGELAYDTDLMLGGGHIKGRFLSNEDKAKVTEALLSLTLPCAIEEKYGDGALAPLLFAVGDGNHSLASAKALYEEVKQRLGVEAASTHPARFALVEVVNIHDEALKFEPIYRVMFGTEPEDVLAELKKYADGLEGSAAPQTVTCIYGDRKEALTIPSPVRQLTVGTLQDFIDGYIAAHLGVTVDYIHGVGSTEALSAKDGAIGFIFDGMGKSELFKTVIFDGALPRKTFSMGHAEDKRYYLEARKINA